MEVLAQEPIKHGLVLSGGGARAAYQVGCLRYMATAFPQYRPQILTGVSAGAINAAHLAAFRGSWADAVAVLSELWLSMETEKVYATHFSSVLRRVLTWGLHLLTGGRVGMDLRGMVDNRPLQEFLADALPSVDGRLLGIDENLKAGVLESLAIITTDYGVGRSIAWVQGGHESLGRAGQLQVEEVQLGLQHILASAALPLFFPAVNLHDHWHGDGGVRLTAPLSPAMHLGANRILAVSPRSQPTQPLPAALRAPYPSPARIAGVLLNAVFLDMLDFDALQMQRINRLLSRLPPTQRAGYRDVQVLVLRPRADLGLLAREHQLMLPPAFRFFERGLQNEDDGAADALSMVIFEPAYIELLMRLGEEDSAARHDEIEAFLRGSGDERAD